MCINYRVKKIINSFLIRFGIQILKVNQNEIELFYDDLSSIKTLDYISKNKFLVINAPTKLGRALPINNLNSNSIHPFIYAVKEAKKHKKKNRFKVIYNILNIYYDSIIPKTAGDLLNLNKESIFHTLPPWMIVMPWDHYTLDEWKENVTKSIKKENYSYNSSANISHG